jgi:hypothetical protein
MSVAIKNLDIKRCVERRDEVSGAMEFQNMDSAGRN